MIVVLARPEYEVPVIRHDRIGADPHADAFWSLSQNTLENPVVTGIGEYAHPPLPAVNHVIRRKHLLIKDLEN